MEIINLGKENSILNQFVAELRDKNTQKDSMRFRRNLERLGEIFAYEISKKLNYSGKKVVTPLGIADVSTPDNNVVLATILRAGIPLHNGLLNFFDRSQCAFAGVYRKDSKSGLKVNFEYCTTPPLDGKVLILADTMVATGHSIELTLQKLFENGKPAQVHIVCALASTDAVDYLRKAFHGEKVTLWAAAIDEELTSRSYIVPGLGDAGDLAFGEKVS